MLYIRSVTEYCSVSFHSSLTQEQSKKLERIQKTCLKVILGEQYVDYKTALDICDLDTLSDRREKRCLDFALKCVKHPRNCRLFPLNQNQNEHDVRIHEPFKVNFATPSTYRDSAIPYCQRLLNDHHTSKT